MDSQQPKRLKLINRPPGIDQRQMFQSLLKLRTGRNWEGFEDLLAWFRLVLVNNLAQHTAPTQIYRYQGGLHLLDDLNYLIEDADVFYAAIEAEMALETAPGGVSRSDDIAELLKFHNIHTEEREQ